MSATHKKETFAEILNGETPVLVDFTATWCGPCKMMKPVLEELQQRKGDRVRIIKIDIDQSTAAANAPVLYVEFRKDGRPVDPDPWWVAGQQKVQG